MRVWFVSSALESVEGRVWTARTTMTQGCQRFGKQRTRSTTNCVVHMNTQDSLHVSNSTSEIFDTHIERLPNETDGSHDSIKVFTPALVCIVQTIDVTNNENHCSIWYSWDSSGRKTRAQRPFFSCPGHLPQERHLECLPVADSNHRSQSSDKKAFVPAVTQFEIEWRHCQQVP